MKEILVISCRRKFYKVVQAKSEKAQLKQLYSLIGCDTVQLMPIRRELGEAGWTLYGDEEGVLRGSPMNTSTNPLFTEKQLIYMAGVGGPCGTMILVPPKGGKLSDILEIYKAYDKLYMEECPDDYLPLAHFLEKALA